MNFFIRVAIYCEDSILENKAKILAQSLQFPIVYKLEDCEYLLRISSRYISLHCNDKEFHKPLYVDFCSKQALRRLSIASRKNELIAKAFGLHRANTLTLNILDATAGLGQDAMILAKLGCKMHLIERSEIVATLLKDGLERAKGMVTLQDTINNIISFRTGDFRDVLISNPIKYDAIYLDPMFPSRTKSALVKKNMRILSKVTKFNDENDDLLNFALQHALQRVVVKRPRLSLSLKGPIPTYTIEGKSTRYDIYVVNTT